MIPGSIKHIQLDSPVWNAVIDGESSLMYLEVREEKGKSIGIVRLDLASFEVQSKAIDVSWWSQLTTVSDGKIYFVEYQDQNDPTRKKYFSIDWAGEQRNEVDQIVIKEDFLVHPVTYEHGTEYHQTVAGFLSLDLPLSCEYLEWNNKIIISYYLRSDKGFERYLLLLKDAAKEWKIKQDDSMKGFSPGAFFVFRDQLIFIKDRNEVCVYTG